MNNPLEKFLEDADRMPVISTEGSKIVEFFNGKNVLVTGATGFLGKLLVEKILRACPEIDQVHVLVRAKKDADIYSRVDDLCSGSLFGPLRKLRPKFQQKINVMRGDLSLPELGLSQEDRQLIIEKVNVIFHIAATVNFTEELSRAIVLNVRGTRDLLTIAEKCKFLDSFVYVSTAYSNCYEKEIKEAIYTMPVSPKEIIDSIDDKAALQSITKDFAEKWLWPNSYVFTKAAAESLVKEYEGKLAACVVRPGAVIATYNEPLKSWNDNKNGATRVVLGIYMGVIISLLCDGEKALDVIPADYVTNCIITAAYKTALEKRNTIKIYNYISSTQNKLTYDEFFAACRGDKIPSINSCWYSCMTLNRYKAIHYLYVLIQLFHAVILDTLLVLSGKRPMMVGISKRAAKFLSVTEYFTTREWKFENGNTQNLWDFLGKEDQEVFPFSMGKLDWDDYQQTHLMGLRTYLLKEDPKNLAQAKKRWSRLYVGHVMVKMAFECLVIYMAYFVLTKIYYWF